VEEARKMALIKEVLAAQGPVDWQTAAKVAGYENEEAARDEFMKLSPEDLKGAVEEAKEGKKREVVEEEEKEEGFVDVDDELFFSCDLLQKFARKEAKKGMKKEENEGSAKLGKKSSEKYKRKIASKMMLTELKSMRTEFSQLIKLDNSLSHIASDYKTLQGQLFAERVSMSTAIKLT